jgi:hypothetical protein
MHKTNLARIFFSLSAIFFIPTYGFMDGLKEKAFKTIENPIVYNAGVAAIDATAKVLSKAITKFAHIPRLQETSEQKNQRISKYIDRIDQRLAHIENNLKQDEINAINDIYKDFKVTNEHQQIINSNIMQYKQYEKEYLSLPHEETNNLDSVPEISSLLKQMSIHPHAVKVELSTSPHSKDKKAIASSQGLIIDYAIDNNTLIVEKILSNPTITLYPIFLELSDLGSIAALGHELGHLASQHTTTKDVLRIELNYLAGIEQKQIQNNRNYKKLVTIHERQAEILHKNAEWASIMREDFSTTYYANQLFLRHYAQLTEIDELHKLKDKLKKLNA